MHLLCLGADVTSNGKRGASQRLGEEKSETKRGAAKSFPLLQGGGWAEKLRISGVEPGTGGLLCNCGRNGCGMYTHLRV